MTRPAASPTSDATILVVDDDPTLLRVVEVGLTRANYSVAVASTGASALDELDRSHPDLVILDLGLPDMDGLQVGRHIRLRSTASILVLSADGAEDRKISALDGGADDYLTKPFSMPELLARIRVSLRHRRLRSEPIDEDVIEIGALQIDVGAHEANLGGRALDLTPKEFSLLVFMARNEGRVIGHRTVLDQVWGPNQALDTLRNHVGQLRRKLGGVEGAPLISTAAGVGYQLVLRDG